MNLDKILAKRFPPTEHSLAARDCMLYALGIGVGARANSASDLQFCYEEGLKIFPAMVNVITHPGPWVKEPELGINWVKLLHGEQSFVIHQQMSPGKTYVGSYRIKDVIDKGAGKGALLYLENTLRDQDTDEVVSTVTSTYFLRGDGGSGGTTTQAPAIPEIPDRAPDITVSLPTLPQAGLIYRLSGDYNPIHADPVFARKAGFERPIAHGLFTMGVATRAVLQGLCDDQPERLRSVQLRFSSPVYPGETIVTEFWQDCYGANFRATTAERGVTVLNNGRAILQQPND